MSMMKRVLIGIGIALFTASPLIALEISELLPHSPPPALDYSALPYLMAFFWFTMPVGCLLAILWIILFVNAVVNKK